MSRSSGWPKAPEPPALNGVSACQNSVVEPEGVAKRVGAAASAENIKDLAWRFQLAKEVAAQKEAAAAAAAGGDAAEGSRHRGKGNEKNFNRIQKVLNRVKHLTEKDKISLICEIKALNLELFLSELADSIVDADLKPSAIKAAIEVIVTLATAYSEFPGLFLSSLTKNIEGLAFAFAAAVDGVPEGTVSFGDSSALVSSDVAAKQQQLAFRLRLLLRLVTDLLMLDVLPVALEPLLLRLLLLAAAVPPNAGGKEQQHERGGSSSAATDSLDLISETAWPVLSTDRPSGSSGAAVPSSANGVAAAEPADFVVTAAAGGVPQGRWLFSVPLCLYRLQALGGVFSRKAAQLLLTQEQQKERLLVAVSSSQRKDAAVHTHPGEKQEGSSAATPPPAVPSADPAAAADSSASGTSRTAPETPAAAEAAEEETLCFETLSPQLLLEAFKGEGLTLPEAEAALAALAIPKSVPSPSCRAKISCLLKGFFSRAVLPLLGAVQKELLQQEIQNMQQTVDKGSVAADALSRFSALSEKYKAALTQAAALADLLELPPPDAAEIERAAAGAIEGGSLLLGLTRLNTGGPGDPSTSAAGGNGEDDPAWRTKEERVFYTEILDLYEVLPPGLLGSREPKEDRTKAVTEQQTAGAATPPSKAGSQKVPAVASAAQTSSDESTAAVAAAPPSATADAGGAMAALLSRFSQATTQQQIDQVAIDFFLERLNTKPNRMAVAKALLHVPRTQLHLLPGYARLLAILRKPLKEETSHVLETLQTDLKRFLEEHDPEKIEFKIKCIRYVSECVKFRLFPPGLVLNAFSSLLEDLTPHRIEMITHLAAGCGYFLLHSRLTEERFRGLMSRMLRLSSARHLPPEQECRLQEVYYELCEGEGETGGQKETKPPLHLFIEKLIFKDLYGSEEEAEEVAKICRKLPWSSNPDVLLWFRGCLLELGSHTNFELVHRHAALLSALAKYIPAAVISCVDCLLEDIQVGCSVLVVFLLYLDLQAEVLFKTNNSNFYIFIVKFYK